MRGGSSGAVPSGRCDSLPGGLFDSLPADLSGIESEPAGGPQGERGSKRRHRLPPPPPTHVSAAVSLPAGPLPGGPPTACDGLVGRPEAVPQRVVPPLPADMVPEVSPGMQLPESLGPAEVGTSHDVGVPAAASAAVAGALGSVQGRSRPEQREGFEQRVPSQGLVLQPRPAAGAPLPVRHRPPPARPTARSQPPLPEILQPESAGVGVRQPAALAPGLAVISAPLGAIHADPEDPAQARIFAFIDEVGLQSGSDCKASDFCCFLERKSAKQLFYIDTVEFARGHKGDWHG